MLERDFLGEKIKIAAKYWAKTKTIMLYPRITESRLKNFKMILFNLKLNIKLKSINQL